MSFLPWKKLAKPYCLLLFAIILLLVLIHFYITLNPSVTISFTSKIPTRLDCISCTISPEVEARRYPNVIWWTPFTPYQSIMRKCPKGNCIFYKDRSKVRSPLTEAVLFYGSDFRWSDLPLPRNASHYWSLLHEESPKNNWGFAFSHGISMFNITSTFSRYSNYPLVTQYLKSIEDIVTPVKYSTALKSKGDHGLVMYLHSDCSTPSDRDSYAAELMKYVKVDSYGKCLHNKDLPDSLRNPMTGMASQDLLDIIGQYKFVLTIENAICEDYITEKLWRTFKAGSVPVYKGSPSVQDWAPTNHSIIVIDDFRNPKELAEYLKLLDSNDAQYEEYLSYKINGVTNERLLNHMAKRDYYLDNPEQQNMVEGFECAVCDQIYKRRAIHASGSTSHHSGGNMKQSQTAALVANYSHYNCRYPRPSIKRAPRNKDIVVFWRQVASSEYRQSKAVIHAINRNSTITSKEVQLIYDKGENSLITSKDLTLFKTKDFTP